VPVGKILKDTLPFTIDKQSNATLDPALSDRGSIIVVVATNAPLLPNQLKRLAQRVPLGVTRTGGIGGNGSGDIYIAFSTANANAFSNDSTEQVSTLPNEQMNALFEATIQATEEAIINALVAGKTTTGINGNKVYGMPVERVVDILKNYNRIK
jgi:L-aminopeptidase/D-esterase-like protein